jgi:hypothetical protein
MQPLGSDDPVEIGRYWLRARLGAGGMGRVYLAATAAGRPVAVKVVRPELSDDQEFRARFRQEIQAAQRVHGLYTAELLDADPDASPPWLVTAYVAGPSLQQAVTDDGPMPEAKVFHLAAGVAEALQAIHAAGLVHRDLKPSNVVLGPDGPRVIDFGIARALESTALTRSGMTVGTVHFMAPEQILDLPVTPKMDIFALGSLAAYAALGRPPFGNGHPAAVSHRVIYEPPDLNGCPPRLRTLVEACLAKQPGDRPSLSQILDFCLERTAVPADLLPPPVAAPVPVMSAASWPVTGAVALAPPAAGLGGASPNGADHPGPAPVMPPSGTMPSARPAAVITPRRPVPPLPVINAVRLIYLGALLCVAGILLAVVAQPAMRAAVQLQHQSPAQEAAITAPSVVVGAIILGTLAGGLWLWTARRIRRGLRGARALATTFFVLNTMGVFGSSVTGVSTQLNFVVGLTEWGAALVATVFLWDRRSGQYFAESRQARTLATPEWPKRNRARNGGSRHRKALSARSGGRGLAGLPGPLPAVSTRNREHGATGRRGDGATGRRGDGATGRMLAERCAGGSELLQ